MKTVFEYTQANLLVIPQALFSMKDVTLLGGQGDSLIFHKQLDNDLHHVEFYCHSPCFIYIESGCETLTNSRDESIELTAGKAIFLPQGESLHSDYVQATQSLKAYLIFFEGAVITEYLSGEQALSTTCNKSLVGSLPFFSLNDSAGDIPQFLASIHFDLKDSRYLRLKLLELLHLIAWKSEDKSCFQNLLLKRTEGSPKRNLQRLLNNPDVLRLSVADLAQISGRSLSSLQRDFKAIYQTTPQKWLRQKKLAWAKTRLEQGALSVTDVALEVGYENLSNFIAAFKRAYGVTPKQLRQPL